MAVVTIPESIFTSADIYAVYIHETFTFVGKLSPNRGGYPPEWPNLSTEPEDSVTTGQVSDSQMSLVWLLQRAAVVTGLTLVQSSNAEALQQKYRRDFRATRKV